MTSLVNAVPVGKIGAIDNVIGGEKNDLTKHIISENYKKNCIAACEIQRISSIFSKRRDKIDKVIYAETKIVMFVAKNNEPFITCDGFSKMLSDMSPYTKLAKKHGAGNTNPTQIIKIKEISFRF